MNTKIQRRLGIDLGLPEDEILIKTMMRLHSLEAVGGPANISWMLVDRAPYDAVICDADSPFFSQSAQPSAAYILKIVAHGQRQSGIDCLSRPVSTDALYAWLARLDDAFSPLKQELRAPSVGARVIVADGSCAIGVAKCASVAPASKHTASAALTGVPKPLPSSVVVPHRQAIHVRTEDEAARATAVSTAAAPAAPRASAEVVREASLAVEAGAVARKTLAKPPIPVRPSAPTQSMHGNRVAGDAQADRLDQTDYYQLKQWPPAVLLVNEYKNVRIASLLSRHPLRIKDLCSITGVSKRQCELFLSQLMDIALLKRCSKEEVALAFSQKTSMFISKAQAAQGQHQGEEAGNPQSVRAFSAQEGDSIIDAVAVKNQTTHSVGMGFINSLRKKLGLGL